MRRSIFSERLDSAGSSGIRLSFFAENVLLIVISCWLGLRFAVAWWVELMLGLKFLAALVSLTLDSVDVTLRAGLYVGSVSFIRIDVHGEFESLGISSSATSVKNSGLR